MASYQQSQPFDQADSGPDAFRIRAQSTDATRYLCAAAYLDGHFTRQVIDEVLHESNRAVAPSYGVDLGPIVRHCLEAERRLLNRDGVVTATLALVMLFAVANGATIVLGSVGLWLAVEAFRMFAKRVVNAGLVLLGAAALLFFLALRGMSQMAAYGGYPEEQGSSGGPWVLGVLALLVIWGAYFWHRVAVHRTIVADLTPAAFAGKRAPAANLVHEGRLAYVDEAQKGNVTVYSPDWAVRPFVGSGVVMTEWNLVTPLRPARVELSTGVPLPAAGDGRAEPRSGETHSAAPFDVRSLYERAREGLVALAHPSLPPHERINHLSVQDRVFVAGLLPADSPFLDAERRPVFRMTADAVQAVDRAERGQTRHYQTVRMAAWQGELEITTFLYAAIRGGMLYVEFVATKLPGIRPEFRAIDSYERLGPGQTVLAGLRAIADVASCPRAVANLGARAVTAIGRALDPAAAGKEIDRRLGFDYGARSSVRELGAHFTRSVRFQDYDANERVSLVERQLLEIVVDTMREFGYDVSDLAGQAATIINNSTLVGSVSGTGVAVGAGSKSTVIGDRRAAAARPAGSSS